MLKDKILSVSIFCLSASIIAGSIIVASSIRDSGNSVNGGLNSVSQVMNNGLPQSGSVYNSNILDFQSAAAYMGITEAQLQIFVNDTGLGMPFIKVDGNYIFNKNALDKWMETARIKIE
jgi:hypothetical protein